jgi:hypothetical protein
MLREIRSVVQRSLTRRKRWFHDDDFDLYLWQSPEGEVLELQLCYERGTSRERALTWKRGIGYADYRVDSGEAYAAGGKRAAILIGGGRFGGWRIREQLVGAAENLDPQIAAFVLDKVAEHCDPPRRFPRRGRSAPNWLRRTRTAAIRNALEASQ